jgi:hypothetical protein
MKRLYRLIIQAWYPVLVEEDTAGTMSPCALQALYEDQCINPYELDDLRLTLEPALPEDIDKYGEDDA